MTFLPTRESYGKGGAVTATVDGIHSVDSDLAEHSLTPDNLEFRKLFNDRKYKPVSFAEAVQILLDEKGI